MVFVPNTKNKYPYPEDTSSHYLVVKKNRGIVFDENYHYIETSKSFRFVRWWVRFLLRVLVFPIAYIRLGLKVTGKKNLKNNKKLIKNGVVTISNHIHLWDYICIMSTLRNYRWPNVIVWDKNINGENGTLMRYVGGIPIPVNNIEGTIAFSESISKLLNDGGILQIYPEGSMWEFYQPIRPFKDGFASIAIKNNKPVIPYAFSYRKPGFIRRVIFKQMALFNLNIGKPIFANENLDIKEKEIDLMKRCHEAMVELAGIKKGTNIYEPIYNHSKKLSS